MSHIIQESGVGHFTLGLDDIYAFLGNMPKSSKDAICYSLFTNTTIEQTINLRWSDEATETPNRAVKMLEGVENTNGVDYVFTENGMPISTLRVRFEINSLFIGWDRFCEIYRDAVAIDFEESYRSCNFTLGQLR